MNESLIWLLVAGFLSGIIGGMGMGGGTLLIPILTLFLSFPQKSAQAINLLVFIPMAIVSLIVHIKNKLVDFRTGIPVIISGVISSICGSILAGMVSNGVLRKIFGAFLLIVGVFQGVQAVIMLRKKAKDEVGEIKFRFFIR